MATMKICVQKQRKDGFYPVYIRVTHHTKVAYIKTDKMVNSKGITRTKEVKDPFVVQALSNKIVDYMDRLNKIDIEKMSIHEVVNYLQTESADICFSDYARKHIMKMKTAGQVRNARNYELALQSLELHAGTTRVMFSALTSHFVNNWIATLASTHRAKEMYPVCIRQIFKAAQDELNDYDSDLIRIRTNPWPKVKIPAADRPEQKAITPEQCRAFFAAPLPESKMLNPLPELGRDVAMMVLCLAGINTVDLYNMQKSNYQDGKLCYKRAKTKNSRSDGAYIEMRVPSILTPLFSRYKASDDTTYLFNFHRRYSTSDSFGANVNTGIKKICKEMGIPKDEWYCVYTFRHTWGTVAQNDCGASIADVAFGMNHSAGHAVTRGYVKIDFSPAWELNEKVIDLIFFSEQQSHRNPGEQKSNSFSRFSRKQLIRGTAFFKGKTLGSVENIGFNNVEEVISALIPFVPDDVPARSMVQFKIENLDKNQSATYERMKGKSF